MTTDIGGQPILILTVDEAELVRECMNNASDMRQDEWRVWEKINQWLLEAYIHNRERETNG